MVVDIVEIWRVGNAVGAGVDRIAAIVLGSKLGVTRSFGLKQNIKRLDYEVGEVGNILVKPPNWVLYAIE